MADEALPYSAAGSRSPWLIAMAVSIATFMEVLDTTIANVALRPYRRQPGRQPGSKYLYPDELSRFERHYRADQRLADHHDRAQTLLHDLRVDIHDQLGAVRHLHVAVANRFLARAARRGRRPAWRRLSNRFSPIAFPSACARKPSRCMDLRSCWRRPSAPCWAAG